MMRIVTRAEAWLFWLVELLAVALLVAVAVLSFYQVLTRFVLSQPSAWTEILTRTCMVWSVYLGAVILFRRGTHMWVDFSFRKVGPLGRKLLNVIYCASAVAVLAVAFFYGLQLAGRVRGQTMAGLQISMMYAYLAIPVGAFLSMLSILVAGLRRGEAGPHQEPIE